MILSSLTVPLTVQGDTLGAPLAITLPSLGRTVGLRYRCGAKSGTVAAPGRLTRAEWTPQLTLAEEYPDRDKIPVKLILDAYENGKIEDSREKQVLLSIPEGFHPTVTLRAAPQAGDRFLQGGQALVEVTASGTLGAEITGCTVRCGDLTGQGQRLCFDLPQAGEIPVTARVTDSRGRSSLASATVSVEPGGTGSESPLVDLNPAAKALGIGCRGDTQNTLSMGLSLDMGGQRLSGLPTAAESTDAMSLGQAAASFLGLRKLWENPQPQAEFPAQTVAAAGALLLIEAAAQAGSAQRVWELAGAAGAIRVLSGSTLAVRTLRQTEAGLEFAAAAPADTWAVPLAVYALKEGSIG